MAHVMRGYGGAARNCNACDLGVGEACWAAEFIASGRNRSSGDSGIYVERDDPRIEFLVERKLQISLHHAPASAGGKQFYAVAEFLQRNDCRAKLSNILVVEPLYDAGLLGSPHQGRENRRVEDDHSSKSIGLN